MEHNSTKSNRDADTTGAIGYNGTLNESVETLNSTPDDVAENYTVPMKNEKQHLLNVYKDIAVAAILTDIVKVVYVVIFQINCIFL